MRADVAVDAKKNFDKVARDEFLFRALHSEGTRYPAGLSADQVFEGITRKQKKLVLFFSQNIRPDAPNWSSYGHTDSELAAAYKGKLSITRVALSAFRGFDNIFPAIRPHPREEENPSLQMAGEFGAIFFPAEAGRLIKLLRRKRSNFLPKT